MTLRTAIEHHRAGRYAEAAAAYAHVLEQEPENADALYLLGCVVDKLGDTAMAVSLMSQAYRLRPAHDPYLLALGAAYTSIGQWAEAQACYRQVLARTPDSASAYFGLGNLRQAAGQHDAAEQAFAQALALKDDFFEARYNLANLQKARGDFGPAIDNYRKALAAAPDFFDAAHNLGVCLHALGRRDEALAAYAQALPCNWPETHNNIGIIHQEQGQLEAALASYRRAIDLRPDYAEALNNLGSALRQLGRLDEAEAALRHALNLTPDYGAAHQNLGDVLLLRYDSAAAIAHYRRALERVADTAPIHFQLGVAHARSGHLGEAQHHFTAVLAQQPERADAFFNLGVLSARMGHNAEAEEHYRQALRLDPDHAGAHINLAALLNETGRRKEARAHLDAAYATDNIHVTPAPEARRAVLILFDAGKGNINLSYLFNERTNTTIDWMLEYAPPGQASRLPPYDVAFNAMGDADLTGDIAAPLREFLACNDRPLLNHPERVARTSRDKTATLFAGIEGIVIPELWRCAGDEDWSQVDAAPLLVRPLHTHGGEGMQLLRDAAEVVAFRARQDEPVFVSQYVDYRSPDGFFRKYRVIYIDRQPFPYHLAISPHWMVHYFSADMAAHAWKLEEERAFLSAPESVLGRAGMAAIAAIGHRLDLDYAGIDFSLLPDGRLLVFEANATMLVHPEDPAGPLGHKNAFVHPILDAFENLLQQKAGG